MKLALAVTVALASTLATGCASPQQKAERYISRISPFCEALGLQPGSPPWADCIQKMASADMQSNPLVTNVPESRARQAPYIIRGR